MTDFGRSEAELIEGSRALGLPLPALLGAVRRSQEMAAKSTEHARQVLAQLGSGQPSPIDIVAFGSLARGEVSPSQSDLDYALIAYHPVTNPVEIYNVREAAVSVGESVFSQETSNFGGFSSALDLVNLIGLEADTNRHQTHRLLLLEESTSLLNAEEHSALVRGILERYLFDYLVGADRVPRPKRGVPRFLLNDVVRYWRTLAVDYQGKRWEEMTGKKWGIRYLKLRSTRKLLFASSVVSLFLPKIADEEVTPDFLQDQFSLTPLARLSQLRLRLQADESNPGWIALRNILRLADYFVDKFADDDFRSMVAPIQFPHDEKDPAFVEVRDATFELEQQLEMLFGSDLPLIRPDHVDAPLTMRDLTERYLLF